MRQATACSPGRDLLTAPWSKSGQKPITQQLEDDEACGRRLGIELDNSLNEDDDNENENFIRRATGEANETEENTTQIAAGEGFAHRLQLEDEEPAGPAANENTSTSSSTTASFSNVSVAPSTRTTGMSLRVPASESSTMQSLSWSYRLKKRQRPGRVGR